MKKTFKHLRISVLDSSIDGTSKDAWVADCAKNYKDKEVSEAELFKVLGEMYDDIAAERVKEIEKEAKTPKR